MILQSTEKGLVRTQIFAVWYALCSMHAAGNTGWYTRSLPTPLDINEQWCFELWRKVAFYSRGWGWRLRTKSPCPWHETMKQMFPVTLGNEPLVYPNLTERIVVLWRKGEILDAE